MTERNLRSNGEGWRGLPPVLPWQVTKTTVTQQVTKTVVSGGVGATETVIPIANRLGDETGIKPGTAVTNLEPQELFRSGKTGDPITIGTAEQWLKDLKKPVREAKKLERRRKDAEREELRKKEQVQKIVYLLATHIAEVKEVNNMPERRRGNYSRDITPEELQSELLDFHDRHNPKPIIIVEPKKKSRKGLIAVAGGVLAGVAAGFIIGGFIKERNEHFRDNNVGQIADIATTPTPEIMTVVSVPTPTETARVITVVDVFPTPTETPRPTAEVAKIPNFGISFDPNGNCQAIDRNTGNIVDVSSYPLKAFDQLTGVGTTKPITQTIQPGQTILVAGFIVDSVPNGVVEVVTAGDEAMTLHTTITDGFTRVVASQDAPVAFCQYLQTAKREGWAAANVSYPSEWVINR